MTTAAVAKKCGRNYTMIERDEKYVYYGQMRINTIVPEIGDIENAVFDQKGDKVAVKDMVNNKYLILGEDLIHKNGKSAKLVDPSGKLKYDGVVASMHEVAAKMMNKKHKHRVNGFDYFFVKRKGNLVSINTIRDNYRIDHGLSLKYSKK